MLAKYHEAFSLPDNLLNMFVQRVFFNIGAAGAATIYAHNTARSVGVRNPGKFASKFGIFAATLPSLLNLLEKIIVIGLNRLDLVFPENQYLSSGQFALLSSTYIGYRLVRVLEGRLNKLVKFENEEDKNKYVTLLVANHAAYVLGMWYVLPEVITWRFWKFMK